MVLEPFIKIELYNPHGTESNNPGFGFRYQQP